MHRTPTRALAVAAAAALLAACATTQRDPAPTAPSGGAERDASAPASPSPTPPPIPRNSRPGQPDWLGLEDDDHLRVEGGTAFEAFGIRVSTQEYAAGYRAHLAGRPPSDSLETEYRALLSDRLLVLAWLGRSAERNSPEFRASTRAGLRTALAEQAIDGEVRRGLQPVPDEELRILYSRRINRYVTPAMVRVRVILVGTEEEANTVIRRLSEDADFAELARDLSIHPSAARGGEIDPFPRGTLGIASLEDTSFRLAPGEVGKVQASSGVFVVQKVADVPEQTTPFESVVGELRREVESEREARARARIIDRMRSEMTR